MATNRLYLLDTETGEHILFAKSYGTWGCSYQSWEMDKWLEGRDVSGATGASESTIKLVTEAQLVAWRK